MLGKEATKTSSVKGVQYCDTDDFLGRRPVQDRPRKSALNLVTSVVVVNGRDRNATNAVAGGAVISECYRPRFRTSRHWHHEACCDFSLSSSNVHTARYEVTIQV